MKTKSLLLSLLLFFIFSLSTVVSAEMAEIHNEFHEYDDSFKIDDRVYELTMSGSTDKMVLFKTDDYSSIIKMGECKPSGNFEYCFENISYEYSDGASLAPGGKLMPALKISIKKENFEDTKIQTSFNYKTSHFAKTEQTFELIIKNTGSDWIRDLKFELIVPQGIKILNARDFSKNANNLSFTTSINKGGEQDYEFQYISDNISDYVISYNYRYMEGPSEKKGSGSTNINIKKPYSITTTLSPENIEIFDSAELKVIITNTENTNDLEVKRLLLRGPPDVVYDMKSNLFRSKYGEYATKIESIPKDSSKEFVLKIKPTSTGIINLTGYFYLISNGIEFEENFTKQLGITAEGLESSVYMNKNDVLSGGEVSFYYVLGNSNEALEFRDFNISIESSFFKETFTKDKILPKSDSNTIYSRKIKVPTITDDQDYDIVAHTRYLTESGEEKYFNKTLVLHVTGSGEIIKLSQSINPGGVVNPGDELTIEVTVENLKDEYFSDVRLLEEFTRGASVSFGDSFKTVDLSPKENKKAYLYKLKIPDKYYHTTLNITSSAVIPSIGYRKSVTQTFTVNPTVEELSAEDIIANSDSQNLDDPDISVDYGFDDNGKSSGKTSFFKSIITGIESFFSGIFGD